MNKHRKEWEEKKPVCPECEKIRGVKCDNCGDSRIQPYTQFLESELERLNTRLTPSAETKAEYSGEFCFSQERSGYDEYGDEDEWVDSVCVPWTTIKEIMKAIKGG